MKFSFSNRTLALTSLVISCLAISLVSLGSASGNTSEIQGCVNKKTFVLRVLAKCTKEETKIRWNVAGIQGLLGEKGATGDAGLPGPKGDKGERGETGIKGDTGDTGIQGLKGEPGVQGVQGLQGLKGEDGAQGPKGNNGDVGPQGPQGPQGSQGPQGAKGDTGVTPVFRTRQVSFIFWENVSYAVSQNWNNNGAFFPLISNYTSPNCPNGSLSLAGIPAGQQIDANTERVALSCVFSVLVP